MDRTPAPRLLEPDTIERVRAALDAGLARHAHDIGARFAPVTAWRGAHGRHLAGRVTHHLGGWRLSAVIAACAFREHRDDPESVRGYAAERLYLNDAEHALRLLDTHAELVTAAPGPVRARWAATRAASLSRLRDWDRADSAMDEALAFDPGNRWVAVERALMLEQRDDLAGARQVVETLCSAVPDYVPAVRMQARLLEAQGQAADALDLLRAAGERAESVPLMRHQLALEVEGGDADAAEQLADRIDAMALCADASHRRALAAERFEIARLRRDRRQTIHWARKADTGFYNGVAEHLEQAGEMPAPRILPVPFVRQNHMTCGPATLDALCQYFGRSAAQADIIEAIWFDGTAEYSERRWALGEGLVAREFRLDWDTAVALIDRDVPFALQTVEVASAHLQAVVGYDRACGTLIIRDPTQPSRSEWRAEAGLEHYASSGPRAMVVLPPEHADRLDGLELPEVALYDLLHELRIALDGHDRPAAVTALASLEAIDPQARLTCFGQYAIAVYDNDSQRALAVNQALLERYPDDRRLAGRHQSWLGTLGRTVERRQALAAASEAPDADASVLADALLDLQGDQRTRPRRRQLLRRLRRAAPLDAETFLVAAIEHWETADFDRAMALYRIAACLGDLQSRYVRSFAQAARFRNRSDEAVDLLATRVVRFGHLSSQPARLLMDLHERLGRLDEAERVAASALMAHADDGELLLQCALLQTRLGNVEAARDFIERARAGGTHLAEWHRIAARVAEAAGDASGALEHLTEVCRLEPLDVGSTERAATMIARQQGHGAALVWLAARQSDFPAHYGLACARIEWLREHDSQAQNQALVELLEHHPDDGWALREHALAALRLGQPDAAVQRAERALALAPRSAVNHVVHAHVLSRLGAPARAREAYVRAVELDVDNIDAVRGLFVQSVGADELKDAAERCRQAYTVQVIQGESLETFAHESRRTLGTAAAGAVLTDAWTIRPDLWQTWVALGRHRLHADDAPGALELLLEGCARFPHTAEIQVALAGAEHANGATDRQRTALRTALRLEPGNPSAVRGLIDSLEHTGAFDEAAVVAHEVLKRDPFDAYALATAGEDAWRRGDQDAALAHMQLAIEQSPDWYWAWDRLKAWSETSERAGLVESALESLKRKYPGDARNLLVEARLAADEVTRLAAYDSACAIEPGNETAVLGRIGALEALGRIEEAKAVADDPVWHGRLPDIVRLALIRLQWRNDQGETALARLNEWLDEVPGYVDAWAALADFHDDLGNDDEYLEAARQLEALAPAEARSHGYVGHALARLDFPAPALAAFERAVELQPDYLFAQDGRFGAALHLSDFATAELALAALRTYSTPLQAARREIRLAQARSDPARGEQALALLACDPSATDADVEDAWAQVAAGYEPEQCHRLLEQLLDAPGIGAAVGSLWVRGVGTAKAMQAHLDRIDVLLTRGPAGSGALAAYFSALGESGDPAWLDAATNRWSATLQADGRVWIALVEALDRRRLMKPAHRWAIQWRGYPTAGPGDLLTVGVTLLGAGDADEALIVSTASLERMPTGLAAWHHCLQAACHALDGRAEAARQCLLAAQGEELSTYFEGMRALAGSLVLADGEPVGQAGDMLDGLMTARERRFEGDPLHDHLWARCVAATAGRLYTGLPGWLGSMALHLRLMLRRR